VDLIEVLLADIPGLPEPAWGDGRLRREREEAYAIGLAADAVVMAVSQALAACPALSPSQRRLRLPRPSHCKQARDQGQEPGSSRQGAFP
jgi:hypothetical protein